MSASVGSRGGAQPAALLSFAGLQRDQAVAVLGAMESVIEHPGPPGEGSLGEQLIAAAAEMLFGLDASAAVTASGSSPEGLGAAMAGCAPQVRRDVAELIAVASLVDGH